MMVKISNGTTFGGIVNYANDLKDKGTTILASRGIDLTNNYTISQSFKVQAMMNRRVENCVGHFALSFPPEDAHRCTDGFMRKLAMEYMRKMGITNTQFVIFRHHDHDHQHVHVVYNRVDDNGKTISDGCDVERAIAICQAMTRQYGLHWSDGKMNVDRKRLKGKAAVKYAINDAAQSALAGSHSWADFIQRMKEQGIQVTIAPRGDGKGMGITFTKGKVSMSGYQVDRRTLTFGNLNERLYNVNAVLPKEYQLPVNRVEFGIDYPEPKLNIPLPPLFDGNPDDYEEDESVNIYNNDESSDFFDTEAAAEAVTNVAAAAVEAIIAPNVVPSAAGGGGGSHDDDEDDEEKKKKRKRPTFHR